MKARRLLLAFCAVSAALQAGEPDWFDAFRGKAFLQADSSYVARDRSAAPDSPPLFRSRWVVLRYEGLSEKGRAVWPFRNLLLVTMPAGARYVLESAFGYMDEKHLEEERPSHRVASSRVAFETWIRGGSEDSEAAAEDPCGGMRHRVRAPGGSLDFSLVDLSTPTVRATLAEISAATFDADERRDLGVLLRVKSDASPSLPNDVFGLNSSYAFFAVMIALRSDVPPLQQRTVVLTPDPAPSGDLSSWRALAHLPLDLPPFPPLPEEGGFK